MKWWSLIDWVSRGIYEIVEIESIRLVSILQRMVEVILGDFDRRILVFDLSEEVVLPVNENEDDHNLRGIEKINDKKLEKRDNNVGNY